MGEIKQLGTIICSLFFQFTHDLKKQISTISYYPYEKFLVKVGTIREGGKRVVSMYFVILCPEANKTPPEMVNPTLPRTSQGVATGFLLQSSMAIQLEWQKNTERHTAGCNLCKGAQDRVTVSYNKEYAGNGRKYKAQTYRSQTCKRLPPANTCLTLYQVTSSFYGALNGLHHLTTMSC